MNNDKMIEELLARVQALEAKVAALSGEETNNKSDEGKEKRCLPGFNECQL